MKGEKFVKGQTSLYFDEFFDKVSKFQFCFQNLHILKCSMNTPAIFPFGDILSNWNVYVMRIYYPRSSSLLQIQSDDNLQSVQLPLVWDFLKVYKLICTFSLPTIFGAEKWWQKCHFIQTYDSWLDASE